MRFFHKHNSGTTPSYFIHPWAPRLSTDEAPRRGTQCAADGRRDVRTRERTARGECSSARALSLARVRVTGSRGTGGVPAAASEGAALARPATAPRLRTHVRERAGDWLAARLRAFLRVLVSPREGGRRRVEGERSRDALACAWTSIHTRVALLHACYTQLSVFPQRVEAIRSQMYRGRGFPAADIPA